MLKDLALNSNQFLRGKAHKLLDEKLGKYQYYWLKKNGPKMHMSKMTKFQLRNLIEKLKNL